MTITYTYTIPPSTVEEKHEYFQIYNITNITYLENQTEIMRLKGIIASLNDTIKKLNLEKQNLTEEKKKLLSQIEELSNRIDDLSTDMDSLLEKIVDLTQENQNLKLAIKIYSGVIVFILFILIVIFLRAKLKRRKEHGRKPETGNEIRI